MICDELGNYTPGLSTWLSFAQDDKIKCRSEGAGGESKNLVK